jgi:hypothetical protein
MARERRVKLVGRFAVRLLLRLVISQCDVGQLQIAVAGGFRTAVNDGPRRLLLLRVSTHQLFVNPKAYRMVIRLGQDRTLRTSLKLLKLCHIENCGEGAHREYNINVTLQEEKALTKANKRLSQSSSKRRGGNSGRNAFQNHSVTLATVILEDRRPYP